MDYGCEQGKKSLEKMSANSATEWTYATWNPVRGCTTIRHPENRKEKEFFDEPN
jgi:hypothetical protein